MRFLLVAGSVSFLLLGLGATGLISYLLPITLIGTLLSLYLLKHFTPITALFAPSVGTAFAEHATTTKEGEVLLTYQTYKMLRKRVTRSLTIGLLTTVAALIGLRTLPVPAFFVLLPLALILFTSAALALGTLVSSVPAGQRLTTLKTLLIADPRAAFATHAPTKTSGELLVGYTTYKRIVRVASVLAVLLIGLALGSLFIQVKDAKDTANQNIVAGAKEFKDLAHSLLQGQTDIQDQLNNLLSQSLQPAPTIDEDSLISRVLSSVTSNLPEPPTQIIKETNETKVIERTVIEESTRNTIQLSDGSSFSIEDSGSRPFSTWSSSGVQTITDAGTLNIQGLLQLDGTTITATATELNSTANLDNTDQGEEGSRSIGTRADNFTNFSPSRDDVEAALAAIDSSLGSTSAAAAPVGAEYVVLSSNGTLSGERVLTAGSGLSLTDGGAGGNATVSVDSSIVTLTGSQTLTNKSISGGSNTITNISGSALTADSLDFTELQDQLDLDASTDILADSAEVLSITNTGSGNSFLVNDSSSDTTPFVIDSSGNVGVGTGSPSFPLSFGTTTGNKIGLYDASGGNGYGFGIQSSVMQLFADSSSSRVGVGYGNSNSFTETLSIKGSNVGINTIGPGASLQILAPDDSVQPALSLRQSNSPTFGFDFLLDSAVNGDLYLNRVVSGTSTNVMTFTRGTGLVGIIDSSPDASLEIVNDGSGDSFLVADTNDGDTTPFVIQSDGDVGIGTASPTGKVHIAGNMSATSWTTAGLQFQASAATYTDTSGSGTIASRVATSIGRPTFASTSAVTITDAATFYIANSPANGTNTTLPNVYSLWIDDGTARFDGAIMFNGYHGMSYSGDATSGNLIIGDNGSSPPSYGVRIHATDTVMANFTNGGVGIALGTTTPGAMLDVGGSSNRPTFRASADNGGIHPIFQATNFDASTTYLTISYTGNLGLGTTTFGTSAAKVLAIGNGTAPSTSPADAIQLWAEDVSSSSELRVRDEAGNVTTLSPHTFSLFQPNEDYLLPWSFYSKNSSKNKELNVDMYGIAQAVEVLSGKQFIYAKDLTTGEELRATPEDTLSLVDRVGALEEALGNLDHSSTRSARSEQAPTLSLDKEREQQFPLLDEGGVSASQADGVVLEELARLTVTGALRVEGDANFLGDVDIEGNAKVAGSLTRGNEEAGWAVIPAGGMEVRVEFDQPLATKPVVNVTPRGVPSVAWGVVDDSATGFTIRLSKTTPEQLSFAWTALAMPTQTTTGEVSEETDATTPEAVPEDAVTTEALTANETLQATPAAPVNSPVAVPTPTPID